MPTDIWVFWSGVLLCLAGVVFHLVRERSGIADFQEEEADTARENWRRAFLLLTVGWLFLHAQMASHAWFLIGGDEYSRVGFSFAWARSPFLVTHDLIWLAGHFYILGGLYKLFGEMHTIILISSALGTLATMYWTGGLAVRLWGRIEAGLFAATVVGLNWIMLWGSVNPLADIFFFPALMLCLDRFVAYFGSHKPGRGIHLLIMGGAIGFGNMFRYESWYVGILVGGFLLAMAGGLIFQGRKRAGLMAICGALLDAVYPLIHLCSSWKRLGSPTQFLQDARAMNEATNLFYQTETIWQRFVAYPAVGWGDHFYYFPLIIGGIIMATMPGFRRRGGYLLAATAIIWTFSMLISVKSGIGSNNRPRYSLFLLLPLFSFLSGPLTALWIWSMPLFGHVVRGVIVAALLLLGASSVGRAFGHYTNGYEWHGDDVAFYARLHRECDVFGRTAEGGLIHPPGVRLAIFAKGDYNFFEFARYHSRFPYDIIFLHDEGDLLQSAAYRDPQVQFAVRKELDNREALELTHVPISRIGFWEVWKLKP